jgi:hypothetical protein
MLRILKYLDHRFQTFFGLPPFSKKNFSPPPFQKKKKTPVLEINKEPHFSNFLGSCPAFSNSDSIFKITLLKDINNIGVLLKV